MSWTKFIETLDINDPIAFSKVLVSEVKTHLQANVCQVLSIEKHQSRLLAATNLSKRWFGHLRLPLHHGLLGLIQDRGEVLSIANMTLHPQYVAIPELAVEHQSHFIGAPIMSHGRLLGLLTCYREDQPFNDKDSAWLVTFCLQLDERFEQMLTHHQSGVREQESDHYLQGLTSVQGVAIGYAVVVNSSVDFEKIADLKTEDPAKEVELIAKAVTQVREDIKSLQAVISQAESDNQDLLSAYSHMVDRHGLLRSVTDQIRKRCWTAQTALKHVVLGYIQEFESMKDPYLKARMIDIQDIGQRVLTYLLNQKKQTFKYPKRTILVGQDISPISLVEVPEQCLVGVCSLKGSRSSHTSILARALGVPMVIGLSQLNLSDVNGQLIFIDGYQGRILVNPGVRYRRYFYQLLHEESALKDYFESMRDQPCQTEDGHAVSMFVNIGFGTDIQRSLKLNADGVGLFRSEVCFMGRDFFPSEQEQVNIYGQLLKAFSPRPVVLRTLDVGGDKGLTYLDVKEENPYLGWRGIRVSLDHPEVLKFQIRAMLKASAGLKNCHILVPMISHLSELKIARKILDSSYKELCAEGLDIHIPHFGMMVEVPAALYQIQHMAAYVDFFSVGSNDMVQYLLAVDRNNHLVSHLYSILHPAVLKVLTQLVKSVHQERKHVSICGEMAGDPMSAVLLVAMGYDSLSMSSICVGQIKWVLKHFDLASLKDILSRSLNCAEAKEVFAILQAAFKQRGLERWVGFSNHNRQ
jgi:phosphotransferase system enzyme I (PtsP)